MRDDFPKPIVETLAKRVGNRCSNPVCRKRTSGPHTEDDKALNVGVAAHITAASPGGPRYDSSLTPDERKSIGNGVWLCQSCAKLVDNDEARYTKDLLIHWKQEAERETLREIESAVTETIAAANVPNPMEGTTFTLTFDPNRDITTQKHSVGYSHDEIIRVVRIRVQNTRTSTVKNCRAYVTQIDQQEASTTVRTVLHDTRCLNWENQEDGFKPIDLIPGIDFRADLIVAEKETPRTLNLATNTNAHIPVFGGASWPSVLRLMSRPPYLFRHAGTWLFTVRVGADSATTETIRLKITWDGTVNGLSAEVVD